MRTSFHRTLLYGACACLLLCPTPHVIAEEAAPLPPEQSAPIDMPELNHEPIEITLRENETKGIPGTNGRLRVTVSQIKKSSITIEVSVVTQHGDKKPDITTIIKPTILEREQSIYFVFDGGARAITLSQTVTSMLGMNYAMITYDETATIPDAEIEAQPGEEEPSEPLPQPKTLETLRSK